MEPIPQFYTIHDVRDKIICMVKCDMSSIFYENGGLQSSELLAEDGIEIESVKKDIIPGGHVFARGGVLMI